MYSVAARAGTPVRQTVAQQQEPSEDCMKVKALAFALAASSLSALLLPPTAGAG